MRERILQLLGSGLAPVVVAQTVGCDPSYISQLLSEEQFAMEVAKLRAAGLEKVTARDNKYDELEDTFLAKLEELVPFMLKPREVLDAISRLNAAKRRAQVGMAASGEVGRTTIIQLVLPVSVVKNFELNSDGEVTKVGDRNLVNLPATTLMESLKLDSGGNHAQISERTQAILPREISRKNQTSALTEDSV